MKKFNTLLIGAASVGMAALAVACSHEAKFIGSWTEMNPTDITAQVPAAARATSLVSITFLDNVDKSGGSVTLSSVIDLTQPVEGDSLSMNQPYEVNVAATASVGGTWTYDIDDKDDILLSFDLSSLNVNIDNNGVTYSQNVLTGAQQPQIDSLTAKTVMAWKQELTRAIRADLSRFSVIEDIEVSKKGDVMTFEINAPEKKLHFRKVGVE